MKKIKVGIAGLGRLGRTHAQNLAFSIPGAELVAACSVVAEELEYAKKELGVANTYDDFGQMCCNPEIDAVAIVSPSAFHAEQIKAALKAGKHIFCEKPLAVSEEECIAIVSLCSDSCAAMTLPMHMRRRRLRRELLGSHIS